MNKQAASKGAAFSFIWLTEVFGKNQIVAFNVKNL